MKNFDFKTERHTQPFVHSKLTFRGCGITHSNLLSIDGSFKSSSVGIKYVYQGTEKYYVNGKDHQVSNGQFLIINSDNNFECSFKEKQIVKGACIHLSTELMLDAYDYLLRTEESKLKNPDTFQKTIPEFYETVYSQSESFAIFIQKALLAEKNLESGDDVDLYQRIALELLISQRSIQSQVQNIKAAKASTKKELYSRLYQAKIIIDQSSLENLNMAAVARECSLSEFHFYRSFKKAFGISPYQYVINQKLSRAKKLLACSQLAITDIAYQTGFADIYSFSKSFKKSFKISPTLYKQQVAGRHAN